MHMRRQRMKQSAFARKAGIHPSILCKIAKGNQMTLKHETVLKLAKACGVDWPIIYTASRNSKQAKAWPAELEQQVEVSNFQHT